ncbi:MAG: sugar transferase [Gemmatimonadota bacterium]|nr:sugar transferase [Gemmatimonadota bacterium]MDH4351707.1 sugar transferase [Gemmatimonadota bacterium]MDH5198282.1 sugar transferase [Gemmatimonadota bacterium]
MKRALDLVASLVGLLVGSVILVPAMIAVWLQDGRSPFYVAPRAARGGGTFRMVKLRSMRILADTTGVMSTAGNDPRITAVGRFVRRWKLDELTQLWNVLRGEMSLVGPRPQVLPDVARYTAEERLLLTVRPGITDVASIVFADEGEVLRGAPDPDLRYHQVIRPWKSRLALLYARADESVILDLRIVWLTVLTIAARPRALNAVSRLVRELGGGEELARVALRSEPLREAPPPGTSVVVTSLAS